MFRSNLINKKVLSWALYDWANSAFALSVLAVLFPLFLGSYWSAGDDGAAVTARLAWVTAASSAVVCLIAPVFGTIADTGGYRKRFLFVLTAVGATATASLAIVGQGGWPLALVLYLFASVGYYSSTVFYDSLIIDVTEPQNFSFVSALGFAIGYLGGALLLAMHVWMLLAPNAFGFVDTNAVIKFAFVSVGVWWIGFLVPLLFFVEESKTVVVGPANVIRAAFRELKLTISNIRQYHNVVVFLCAYWCYIGGVFTVIFLAVNFGQRLGFSQQDLVTALMITNFVGFPATLLYGYFGHRFGPKRGIYFALMVYIAVSGWAAFMVDVQQFYIMAIVIGCVQGGVQGMSRSMYAALIPPEQPGEFFGFYGLITKFAHILGPVMVAVAASLSDNPKWVLLAVMPLFVIGALLLSAVHGGDTTAASE